MRTFVITPFTPVTRAKLLFLLTALTAFACGSASGTGTTLSSAGDGGTGASQDDASNATGNGTPDAGESEASAASDGSAITPSACAGRTAQPLDAEWTLSFGGRERVAKVHVPATVKPDVAAPVVLNFHGFTSNADQQRALSGLDEKADLEGFVAVHPEGLDSSWNAGACCGTSKQDSIDDVGFVSALLDRLESTLCVDKARVFATGMSNGGFFSHKLACVLDDRIAAVAPVAGVNGLPTCTPKRPVPVLHIHGTLDALVPYFGDFTKGFRSVRSTVEDWAVRNGCSDQPNEVFKNLEAHCETYPACKANADVMLCVIEGGGHTWPGGLAVPALGYTSYAMSATDRMWEFFKSHPM